MSETGISHVSDTALMVSAARAVETALPDGLIRDPFAERLAGDRGMAILRNLPNSEVTCFGVGVRSRFMDQLVMELVQGGSIGTVLSLGAGLDTRPWRLDLPERMRWIEVDFPEILEYKHTKMAGEQARCRLERIPADLTSAEGRGLLWAGAEPGRTLMITEGLLMYLPAETVEGLAVEAAGAGVAYWLMDVFTREFARSIGTGNYASVEKVRAANHLDGLGILDAVRRNGWVSRQHRNYRDDVLGAAPDRVAKLAQSRAASGPRNAPPPPDDPSGIHLFSAPAN
jgi:methyltransferase (TIGR00027 family)